MANYSVLKSGIRQVIKENGNNEITGDILQSSLISMIETLGVGYQFVGVATPSTVPSSTDAKVMYLAATAGTYTYFGGLVLANNELAVLYYDSAWHKETVATVGGGGGDGMIEVVTPDPQNLSLATKNVSLILEDIASGKVVVFADDGHLYWFNTALSSEGKLEFVTLVDDASMLYTTLYKVRIGGGDTGKELEYTYGEIRTSGGGGGSSALVNVQEQGLYIVDPQGRIGAKITNDGFFAINIPIFENVN